MKELSIDAKHASEDPKPLRGALKDFMFSSAPAETYVVESAGRPPYEIEIYKGEGRYVVRAPGLKRQAALEARLKSLAGAAKGIDGGTYYIRVRLTFEALQRAAGIDKTDSKQPPTDE